MPSTSLGIQVDRYYLHWAPKSVNITYIGLFGPLELWLQNPEEGISRLPFHCQEDLLVKWTPHPVIVTIRDNRGLGFRVLGSPDILIIPLLQGGGSS